MSWEGTLLAFLGSFSLSSARQTSEPYRYHSVLASLIAQMVKNLPAVQETRVRSLGQEDPLEKEMATHSSILAWKVPWTEEPGGLQSMGSQIAGHDWATNTCTYTLVVFLLKQSDFNPRLSNLFPVFRWNNDLGRLLKLSLPSQELVWPCLYSPTTGNTSPLGLSPSGPSTRVLLTKTWSLLKGEASPAP